MCKIVVYFCLAFTVLITGCKKDDPVLIPKVNSMVVDEVKINSVTLVVKMENTSSASSKGVNFGIDPINFGMTSLIEGDENESRVTINDLLPNTLYYAQAFVVLNDEITYSEVVSFWTYAFLYDGDYYHTVELAGNVWTVENLKTTHYRNGDEIEAGPPNFDWISLKNGAYCNYQNSDSMAKIYGRLYNYLAISDSRNIAPAGWHIASKDEWNSLSSFTMEILMGGIWDSTLLKPNNKANFNILPAGNFHASTYSSNFGYGFNGLGEYALFASSSFYDDGYTYWMIGATIDGRNNYLIFTNIDCASQNPYGQSGHGLSVRLVKDK